MGLLRVSCVVFCRVKHEGRYLFILNAIRARAGDFVVTPIGGGIEYAGAPPPVLAQIHAEPEKPGTKELRFYIEDDADRLAAFRAWFIQRRGREVDPFRELHEELVEEPFPEFMLPPVLPALSRQDVRYALARTTPRETRQLSNRPGIRVADTHYFQEIFDVAFVNPAVLQQLLDGDHKRGIFWLPLERAGNGAPLSWQGRDVGVRLVDVLRD